MYEVEHFSQTSVSAMRAYVAQNSFASLAVDTDEGPSIDHLPLEFDPTPGPDGRLLGHVARGNPLWRRFESGPALAVFCGHQAYISPDWYSSKASEPRVVPTWNYAAVHVSGTLRFLHEPEQIFEILSRLTERFESSRPTPWTIADAPEDFVHRLVGAVVGVELEVRSMKGKWKLSQNRPAQDRKGVIAGLRSEGGSAGHAMADLMERRRDDESRPS
jgi:transcriptional regulator